jgi:poly(A) polymerase
MQASDVSEDSSTPPNAPPAPPVATIIEGKIALKKTGGPAIDRSAPRIPRAGGEEFVPETRSLFLARYDRSGLFSLPSWRRGVPAATSVVPDEVHVVTFNVFFAQQGQVSRAKALLAETLALSPHIVALQEVTAAFLVVLKEDVVVRENYWLAPEGGFAATHGCWYGVTFLVRKDIVPVRVLETTVPSGMGRILLTLQYDNWCITTAHFESLATRSTRKHQLEIAHSAMGGLAETHVICGDFNMTEMENGSVAKVYQDAWLALHPGDPGITFSKTNATVQVVNPSESWEARCDRYVIKSTAFTAAEIRIIGTAATAENGTMTPSDHYGLFAVFRKESAGK